MAIEKSKDFDVRATLMDFLLARGFPRRNIRHELTLDTSSSGGRCDVVLLLGSGHLAAVEIKSGTDKLDRLEHQEAANIRAFDFSHAIIDRVHAGKEGTHGRDASYCHEAKVLVDWNHEPLGEDVRPALLFGGYQSRHTNIPAMARLLWRSELIEATDRLGARFSSRSKCLEWLRDHATLRALRPLVHQALLNRQLSQHEETFWNRYDVSRTPGTIAAALASDAPEVMSINPTKETDNAEVQGNL